MQITKKYTSWTIAIALTLVSLFLVIHKTDQLSHFRFLQSMLPLYAAFAFFAGIAGFVALQEKTWPARIHQLCWLFLPTVVTFAVGVNATNNLHYAFDLIVGAYMLTAGFLWIYKRHQKMAQEASAVPAKEVLPEDGQNDVLSLRVCWAFIGLIMVFHLGLGLYNLGKAAYVDESLWLYGRIEKYWNNIAERDWQNARPSDKPGVTVAALSGAGLLVEDPARYAKNEQHKEDLPSFFAAFRLPLVIVGTIAIPFFFSLCRRLTNRRTALIVTAFIGLSPLLLGMSRIVNPDALTWIFMPLTFLALLLYFIGDSLDGIRYKRGYLYAAGVGMGLSLLTKYIGNVFFIFFVGMLLLNALFTRVPKDALRPYLRERLVDLGIFVFIALAVFYVFFPGVWVKHDRLLIGTLWSQPFLPVWQYFVAIVGLLIVDVVLLKARVFTAVTLFFHRWRAVLLWLVLLAFAAVTLFVSVNAFSSFAFIDFENFLASPKSAVQVDGQNAFGLFLSSFYPLLFGIHPLAFVGILAAILFFWITQKKQKITKAVSSHTLILFYIMLFIFLFYFGASISLVGSTVRYQILLYPLIFFVAAIGLEWIIQKGSLEKRITWLRKRPAVFFTVLFFITFLLSSFWSTKTDYFSYNSSLLPQPLVINPKDMGDGNYEVAQFLNSLPNAERVHIWSDKRGVCAFFVGTCVNVDSLNDYLENGPDYDYYVVSRGRKNRTTRLTRQRRERTPTYPLRLDRLYDDATTHIFETTPGKRDGNYIRIIDAKDVTVLEQ